MYNLPDILSKLGVDRDISTCFAVRPDTAKRSGLMPLEGVPIKPL